MPDKIVLEGYSLNLQHASSVVPLVELGGLLRFMLFIDGFKWFDPRASEVKKFVTGKGNSPKDQVMMHVLKRWGHTSKSNNTADAFVCAAMGLAHANRLAGVTVDMRAIVGKLGLTIGVDSAANCIFTLQLNAHSVTSTHRFHIPPVPWRA